MAYLFCTYHSSLLKMPFGLVVDVQDIERPGLLARPDPLYAHRDFDLVLRGDGCDVIQDLLHPLAHLRHGLMDSCLPRLHRRQHHAQRVG